MNTVYIKLGKLLKLERERQNIKLESVSEELNITLANLECIEAGNADGLPSELYFNLFAKSYAEMIGIDFTKTVEAIKEDVGESEDKGEPEVEEKERRTKGEAKRVTGKSKADRETEDEDDGEDDDRRWIKRTLWVVGIVVGIFIVVVVAVLLFFGNGPDTPESGTPEGAPITAEAPENDEQTTSELASFEWSTPNHEAPSPLTLTLTAKEESWATILADGDTAIFRNLVPWREYTEKADYRFVISIAHPAVVEVKLNGQAVELRDPESRRISRVEVNQVNAGDFLSREPLDDAAPRRQTAPSSPANAVRVTDTTQSRRIDSSQPDSQATNEED